MSLCTACKNLGIDPRPEIAMQTTPGGGTTHHLLEPGGANVLSLWLLVIAVSPASEIACQLLMGVVPSGLVWARVAVLAAVANHNGQNCI
jgi:hypothetical protein